MKKNNIFLHNSELFMVMFAIGTLLILFLPIPAQLLDFLLIINFSGALTVLLLAFYTDKPLSFSTFPALLLIFTLFRLSLNVAATRLILSDGKAGQVIRSIGQYVILDNYVMGLVVFLILIIVQYVVITNGAQRVAEVAARFTLDSMPGKQMSIDADLNMGLISQKEAQARRSQIEKEANFYGAMDGASKFVKGDAIAGILIILVDLIGGFAIGMAQKGLSFSESLHTYSLLTVGDGLVTQIPALTISLATGIIVTRAASDAQLGSEVARQILAYPKNLILICIFLLGLIFLKGIPVIPLLSVFTLFALVSWYGIKSNQKKSTDDINEESLYEKIRIYPIEIQLNRELLYELKPYENNLLQLIQQIRERLAYEMGFIIPDVKLRIEDKLNYPYYTVCIQGNQQGVNPLYLEKHLVIGKSDETPPFEGIEVREPSYGLRAFWLDEPQQAKEAGYAICNPITVLVTHLGEVVQNQIAELLSRSEIEHLLNQEEVKTLRDDLIPGMLSFGHVQRILQGLLQEKVSIRNLSAIMEVLLEYSKTTTDPSQLIELVRSRLATPICQKLLLNQNKLPVITLEASLEQQLNQSLTNNTLALEPSLTERLIISLASQVEQMLSARKKPVLVCSPILRRHIKLLTQRVIPHLTVLGMNEIPINIQVEPFGIVK